MPRKSPHDGFLYPAIDRTQLGWPNDNAELFRQGKISMVACMFGSADDDLGSSFATGLVPKNVTAADYPKYLHAISRAVGLDSAGAGNFVAQMEANYPLSRRGGDVKATLLDLIGDSNLACPQHTTATLVADALANATGAPVPNVAGTSSASYAYSFKYRAWQQGGQAFHASDLPFFFGDSAEFDDADAAFNDAELKVRDSMQLNLLHFVKYGRPSAVDWPPFGGSSSRDGGLHGGSGSSSGNGRGRAGGGQSVMEFGTTSTVVSDWKKARCDMWAKQREQTRWLGDSELQRILRNVTV